MNTENIVILSRRQVNKDDFNNWDPPAGFSKHFIGDESALTFENLQKLNPKFIFIPHWSKIIDDKIIENFKCVVFHMTDLPFGRGGSPLQNLLVRGIYKTKISAILAVKELDAGPIYLKKDFDISEGSAEEIYSRASKIIFEMIDEILRKNLNSTPQTGEITVFKRRTPAESEVPESLNERQLYDFIRMLDAPGYPHAFKIQNGKKIEFKNARFENDKLIFDEISQ